MINKERLSILLDYFVENREKIAPTFDMHLMTNCLIWHLPKVFPEDWKYEFVMSGVMRPLPIFMAPENYDCETIMDNACEYFGVPIRYYSFVSGNNTLDQQIELLQKLLVKYHPNFVKSLKKLVFLKE